MEALGHCLGLASYFVPTRVEGEGECAKEMAEDRENNPGNLPFLPVGRAPARSPIRRFQSSSDARLH